MAMVSGVVLPVFGVVLVGFLVARLGVLDKSANDGLSRFVFNIAIPCMLFHTMATVALTAVTPWPFLTAYYLGALSVFGIALLATHWLFRRTAPERALNGMASCYSNAVLLGIPLVLAAYGEASAVPLFLMVACQGPLLFALGTLLVESALGSRGEMRRVPRKVFDNLVRNPVILSIAAGLIYNLSDIGFIAPVESAIGIISKAVPACALVSLGASLSQYRLSGDLREPLLLVGLKNIVQPLIVWLLASFVFALPLLWVKVAVVLAALPSGVMAHVFARHYQLNEPVVSQTIILSTTLSLVTLSLILWLL